MDADTNETGFSIGSYYDFLFEGSQGFVHAATKEGTGAWKEYFFQWPVQRAELIQFTEANRSSRDVYVAPALFKKVGDHIAAKKEYVQGSTVVWVDFDGEVPSDLDGVPPPTLRLASGGNGHEHWYWKLDTELNSLQLETINRALTYKFNADESGWDATQVLRPPMTFNHKRKQETAVIDAVNIALDPALFSGIEAPPRSPEIAIPENIPPVEQVVAAYKFTEQVRDLFFEGGNTLKEDGTPVRYKGLMQLGYFLAEMQMSEPEILSLLLNADERWGKFKGRSDRMRRLMEIVTIAKQKYPIFNQPTEVENKLVPIGFKSLLATEVKLEWQWESFLQQNGYFLLTGQSGVGKTQFSLDAAGHMVNGLDFMGKPTKKSRIGFFSLEMGIIDLKYFLQQLQYAFTPEQQEVMEENLLFFPLGEPLYMTKDNVRDDLSQLIGDLKLDGIMVDSLGSVTDEALADEAFKKFFHWNDTMRQKHDIFTWYIHHHRKASGDNRKPNKLSDVYGSQYITSYATTVSCLWDSGTPNVIDYLPLKMRLSEKPKPFQIGRDKHLHFTKIESNNPQLGNSSQAGPMGNDTLAVLGGAQTGAMDPMGGWSIGPDSANDKSNSPSIDLNLGGI